jgi:Gas vesicle protein
MSSAVADREVALVDLLDRLLGNGAVLSGEITLTIADVDLVHVSLRALITSVTADRPTNPAELKRSWS